MGNIFNLDNPLWRTVGKLVDVCLINIIYMILCIPIVTIGPATTALYYVMLKIVRDEESHIYRMFFRSFKENFKQGTIIGVIMTLLGLFFAYDIYLYFQMEQAFAKYLAVFFIGVFIIYLMALTYVFPILSKFVNTVGRTMKNAVFMSIRHVFRSIIMLLVLAAMIIGVLYFPPLILLGPGLVAFINSYMFVKIFDLYIPKEEKKENEDLFMTNAELRAAQEALDNLDIENVSTATLMEKKRAVDEAKQKALEAQEALQAEDETVEE